MTTTTLNARDFPAAAYTVFFDRAEAKRDFTGIKLPVRRPSSELLIQRRKASMKSSSKTSLQP
jgi:hypothetical protein